MTFRAEVCRVVASCCLEDDGRRVFVSRRVVSRTVGHVDPEDVTGGPSRAGLRPRGCTRSITGAVAQTEAVITDQCRYTSELKPFSSVVGVLYGGRQVHTRCQTVNAILVIAILLLHYRSRTLIYFFDRRTKKSFMSFLNTVVTEKFAKVGGFHLSNLAFVSIGVIKHCKNLK